jgi:hypothetical protein
MRSILTTAVLAWAAVQSSVCASEVASVNAGRNTEATAPPDDRNGTFGGSSISTVLDTVDIDLTALAKHRSFDVFMTLTDTNAVTDYTFTIDMTNMVGLAPVDPLQNPAIGDDIGPIDVEIISLSSSLGIAGFGTNVPATFLSAGAATLPFAANGNFVNGAAGTSTHIRIGGLLGGGYAIPHTGTGTFSFVVRIPDFVASGLLGGGFALRFTANPEPGTMILISIVIASFAGLWFHQRRQAGLAAMETAA